MNRAVLAPHGLLSNARSRKPGILAELGDPSPIALSAFMLRAKMFSYLRSIESNVRLIATFWITLKHVVPQIKRRQTEFARSPRGLERRAMSKA
jgi:hypothetical protein